MYRHTVAFKLKGTPEKRRQIAELFRDALYDLPSRISVIKNIQVGLNENPAETWDLVLIVDVPEFIDIEIYSKHPAHLEAAAIIAPYKEDRACVDYPL